MKDKKLKVRQVNAVQLSKDMRLSREIHEALRKIDRDYKDFCGFKFYFEFENEENINEKSYLDKRGEQLEKAKERMQKYYGENLRRIVNTLKVEILFELVHIYEEDGNFDRFERGDWDNLEGLLMEESIEEYINIRFEVQLDILHENSERYYAEICEFMKDAILERDRAYEILRENVNIISRQVNPSKFVFGISDEENFVFSEECNPSAFDMMIYSAVISILYEIEHQVFQELDKNFVADDVRNVSKSAFDNILQKMTIYITPQRIFNMLSGREDKEPSIQVREAIMFALERLSEITVEVNDPQLKQARHRDSNDNLYLLSVRATTGMMINRRKRNYALYLQEVPPLYDLAKNKQKLLCVDISILDVPLENGIDNIALKGYLLRQIVIAKNTRKKELVISYKKLYRSIGIKDSGRGMSIEEQNKIHLGQLEIRKKVKKCLEFWKKQGLIRRADMKSTKRALIYL